MERSVSSLPVSNVQTLAASLNGTSDIPERYIRPEAEADPIASDADVELPIIDLGRLLDPQLSQEESAKLELACEEWGFFQLINHGISTELIEKMKVDITEFFKLPLKEKEACGQIPNNIEGYGQAFVVSEEQKLDWGDMLAIVSRPHAVRNMRFWPTNPPTFRDTLDKYSLAVKEVASCLSGLMAKNLGLDPEIIRSKFKDQPQSIFSNGKYKSIEHRAIINTEKERLSIAAFHGPSPEVTVGPLPELVKGGEEQYKTMGYVNYMRTYFSSKLDGKSLLESMKLGK